ncbi:diguanylate cyclase domain-containing protein [Xanthobacter pseudotagetidis]|uniref:diguanylate cyclase domain-containing protein n=1 Tax=Xanthobacter pseudotagetidis TaxID=3119911 RepID=UPI003728F261
MLEKWAQVKGRDGAGTPPAQPAFDSAMEAFVRVASAALPGRVVEVWLTDAARARIGRAGPSDPRAAVMLARTGTFADVFEIADMGHDPDFAATGALPPGVVAVAPLLAGSGLVVAWSRAQAALAPAERALLRDVAALLSAHLAALTEEREASEQRDLYALIAEHNTDTLVRGNLEGVRLYISSSVRDLLGYAPEEMVGRRAAELVHPDDLPEFRRMMEDVRAGRVELLRTEHRQRRKDGAYVWLEAYLKLTRDKETGAPDGYVASVRDISQRKAAEEALAFAASHDPLTGLPNRVVGEARLSAALARWAGGESAVAVLMLDLDRFKAVNDTLGHGAGDQVLHAAAERFRAELRAGDLVARVGGDEFLVVVEAQPAPGAGAPAPEGAADAAAEAEAAASRLADRLIAAMAKPVMVAGRRVSVGLSAGIAAARPGRDTPAALLKAADAALYAAKAGGRNGWRVG